MKMKTYIGTKIIEAIPAIRKGGTVYEKDQPIPKSMDPSRRAIRSATRTATRALVQRMCLRPHIGKQTA